MVDSDKAGRRVFVVEDEFLLALGLEDDLKEAGYVVIGPFRSLAQALSAEKNCHFDGAILDINLSGELVYPLAEKLIETGKPFLFLTGYTASDIPERFRGMCRLSKPYDAPHLLATLAKLLEQNS